jgi:hypothetical protein
MPKSLGFVELHGFHRVKGSMRIILALVAALLLLGKSVPAAERESPSTRPATQPALRAVDLHYGIYLARLDVHTTITPDGLLRSITIQNKSYGPKDIDPKSERKEIRRGQLTPEQIAELVQLFAGWDALPDKFTGVPDGPAIELRYGEKTVTSGGELPDQVARVYVRIQELTRAMPVAKE